MYIFSVAVHKFQVTYAKEFWDVRFINNVADNYFVKKQVQKMTLNMPLS